jgi:hypothetical protein
MWWARRSQPEARVAIVTGIVLAFWAITATVLARRGAFLQRDPYSVPPIAAYLGVVLIGLALALATSKTLRSLLTNQKHLIWLNVWRLVGVLFLALMANGRMPALWALPAGIGDVLVGLTAPWIASHVDRPGGRRKAIVFNLFGAADLIVAVGMGIMTSPSPLRMFHTTPSSEFATFFPLALVPTFLVPLAFALHMVSLWQLLDRPWTEDTIKSASPVRSGY